jgi:hypothetical protein
VFPDDRSADAVSRVAFGQTIVGHIISNLDDSSFPGSDNSCKGQGHFIHNDDTVKHITLE